MFNQEQLDLTKIKFTPELLRRIPAQFARDHQVLPIWDAASGGLAVAMADPSDLNLLDTLVQTLNLEITVCVADQSQLKLFIEQLYGDGV